MKPLLLLAGLLLGSVEAADIYLSPNGADINDGTSEAKALKTVPAAQQAVQAQLAKSPSENVTVRLAPGTYTLSAPLRLTDKDSGKPGTWVKWVGQNATMSGGLQVTGWTAGSNGIYSASVPVGTKSRNLYVNGKASNFARKMINRKDLQYTNTSVKWTNPGLDWITSVEGIAKAEMRWINSFTDRYAPILAAKNRELVMKQNWWFLNTWGYDHIAKPNADFGVWIQNALPLLSEGGQFYLDSAAGKVYYKPLNGENMAMAETYLGILETLVVIGGDTYASPAHDISFSGIDFAHTTWNAPTDIGYVDQQTGGHLCENKTYTPSNFESARPWWCQMPSAIQISAANNVALLGGSYTQMGGGGVGIGNDANAHLSGVGLGASRVSVADAYFSQIMGNSITAGGIRADAHHPADSRMTNSHIDISNNIFYNVSTLYSSTVPIFLSYVQHSTVSHNEINTAPYSGICLGYGWGSNDAGGTSEYVNRGLYAFQPRYSTPTISTDNRIEGNLIHGYGYGHTDLGALYTLSKSPSTYITENYALDSSGFGLYNDEGSNGYIMTNNILMSTGIWSATNGAGTTNNTYAGNYYRQGATRQGNTQIRDVNDASVAAKRIAYRAGIPPAKRTGRPIGNPGNVDDGAVILGGRSGKLAVTIENFDDAPFTGVEIEFGGSNAGSCAKVDVPSTIMGNGAATATYTVSGPGSSRPSVSVTVRYVNSRTGEKRSLSTQGTVQL
ncbi:Xylanase A [Madurella fahalii]|uniref:Xylanase A n=1 Tax=Madurella fahalii TaxID=1157608 RepID=A0ABQ0GH69_9PEZI